MEEEKPNEKKTYDSPLKPLRTYEGDVSEIIGKKKVSMASVVVAEENKRRVNPPPPMFEDTDNTGAKNKFFIILGSLFLILGLITVVAVYYSHSQNTVQKMAQNKAILSYSEEFNLPIASTTRNDLIDTMVSKEKSFKSPINSILYINTTEADATGNISNVVKKLAPSAPESFVRNLNDKYMIGVYSFDTNEPFIILTTNDYGNSFAGMLEWEENMIFDLGKLFSISPKIGTSTPYVFGDESIRNKDLRIIKDENGKTVLLYSFIDKNTILITSNEKIFNAILGKYFTSQMTR